MGKYSKQIAIIRDGGQIDVTAEEYHGGLRKDLVDFVHALNMWRSNDIWAANAEQELKRLDGIHGSGL